MKDIQIEDSEIRAFFLNRPAINISKFENEAHIPTKTLDHFLKERPYRNLGDHRHKIVKLMYKYGFDIDLEEDIKAGIE